MNPDSPSCSQTNTLNSRDVEKPKTTNHYSPYEHSAIFQVLCMRLMACERNLRRGKKLPGELYNQMAIIVGNRSDQDFKSYTHKRVLQGQPCSEQQLVKARYALHSETDPEKRRKLLERVDQEAGVKSLLNVPVFMKFFLKLLDTEEASLGKRSLQHLYDSDSECSPFQTAPTFSNELQFDWTAPTEKDSQIHQLKPTKASRKRVHKQSNSKISEKNTKPSLKHSADESTCVSREVEENNFQYMDVKVNQVYVENPSMKHLGAKTRPRDGFQLITGEQMDELLCEFASRPGSSFRPEPEQFFPNLHHNIKFANEISFLTSQQRELDCREFSPARHFSGRLESQATIAPFGGI